MKRVVVLFISLFLTPIGGEDNKEMLSHETITWTKILQIPAYESSFPRQEVIEPLFCESLDLRVGRV
ncbi:hypothetical protein [Chlamydia felis Fe/C-56]|uniref:Uncharacterized protein n=1 Tax=Chlamydia felis (strain Fe/C-56) TaxID=264202 RepID=Q252T7_CHLFF|nr:hypothetical protein [Chlamydia felis Fe/C-56]